MTTRVHTRHQQAPKAKTRNLMPSSSNLGGPEAGDALCTLLETGDQFAIHVRDELLKSIFNKIKLEPSANSLLAIKRFVKQRKRQVNEGDKIPLTAQETLISREKALAPQGGAKRHSPSQTRGKKATDPFIVPVVTEAEFDRHLREQMSALINSITGVHPSKAVTQQGAPPPVSTQKSARPPQSEELKGHTEVWRRLYETMSEEESLDLRNTLKFHTYQPGEMVVARGNLQASLHLFDSGTVRQLRNKPGEEAHFKDMEAGELIGSDIFLSGEPWNLALYAGTNLTDYVYNLGNLLVTRIELPQLADKIIGFFSFNDILLPMVKILGAPLPKFQETARFLKKSSLSEQIVVLQKLPAGVSFLLPSTQNEKLSKMPNNKLEIYLGRSSRTSTVATATVAGVIRSVAKPLEILVFAHCATPLDDAFYFCQRVKVLKGR